MRIAFVFLTKQLLKLSNQPPLHYSTIKTSPCTGLKVLPFHVKKETKTIPSLLQDPPKLMSTFLIKLHKQLNNITWKNPPSHIRKNKFSNLRVGQGSTEMLLDVGLQDRVEMLKFSVSNQPNDKYLKINSITSVLFSKKIFSFCPCPFFLRDY